MNKLKYKNIYIPEILTQMNIIFKDYTEGLKQTLHNALRPGYRKKASVHIL